MLWTSVFWVLMSSAIIAPSFSDESRHKRSLSYITSLFFKHMGRNQENYTKSSSRPSKTIEISKRSGRQKDDKNIIAEETTYKEVERIKNSVENCLSSNQFQAISQNFEGSLLPSASTEKSIKERPPYIDDSSRDELLDNYKTILTTTPKNLKIDKTVYNRPESHTMSSVANNYVSSTFELPRKYIYRQIKGDTVQTFALDKNSDVIVTETRDGLPRAVYVGDINKDDILSVPEYTQHVYSSIANGQYEEATIKPKIVFDNQPEKLYMMLPHNDIFVYHAEPIVLLDDTSELMETSMSMEDNEMNKIIEQYTKVEPRGDIPN